MISGISRYLGSSLRDRNGLDKTFKSEGYEPMAKWRVATHWRTEDGSWMVIRISRWVRSNLVLIC